MVLKLIKAFLFEEVIKRKIQFAAATNSSLTKRLKQRESFEFSLEVFLVI